jgi:hypothetical protein
MIDAVAGILTASSLWAILLTLPLLHYTNCGTGINDPMSYAIATLPFILRCFIIHRFSRPNARLRQRGFLVVTESGQRAAE